MAMSRNLVSSSPFGQFMASTAGRVLRGVIGAALIVGAVAIGGAGAWALGVLGVILVAAGVFDFCVITGVIDNVWSGREVRARRSHASTRAA
jgi:hypothetical protein